MSNKSRWKEFEAEVAKVLGGKRRHRTMGSYSTTSDDVRFRRKDKKKCPALRHIRVECKKRRKLDIPMLFAEAVSKYGEDGKHHVLLATRRPVGRFEKKKAKLEKRIRHRYREDGMLHKKRVSRLKARLKKDKEKLTKRHLKKLLIELRKDMHKLIQVEVKQLRAAMTTSSLMTVELSFFGELWTAWKEKNHA